MPSNIVIECSHKLKDHQMMIAFAESVTAGKLVSEFSLIPNCGSVLAGSIVSYDTEVKKALLHVPAGIIEQYTAESAEVTEQMAIGLQQLIKADVYVAVTGLAAEGGSETPEKPVGTMFVHGFFMSKPFSERLSFTGDPEHVILQTVNAIADIILKQLSLHQYTTGKKPEDNNCQ